MNFLSGFTAILGPPNVGKSTLLNRILGAKIAIVTPKPQTTRNRILGIYHGDGFQIVFIDTPGIHRSKTALHRSMVDSALASIQEVDLVLLMVEAGRYDTHEVLDIITKLQEINKSCILAINKIDILSRKKLLPAIDHLRHLYPFEAVIPISALTGDGVDSLLCELKSRLKPGPRFYPEEMKSDQTESFVVSEIVREKIYLYTRQEIPYSSAVTVNRIEERPGKNLIYITATIHTETESQKKVVIGKAGHMIKAIGKSARESLERIFGMRVYLDLFVRVEKNWSHDAKALRRLGY